ncbi:DNA primase [Roseateles sp. BYS180W]|uniref:DNA primase n=1 Tax=Roseateles rivi TaxID=3299028 RepID=A0ABW7FVN9_9BURK
MIPTGFIQDLLARTDIVDVISRHVELKKAGINHKGLCPFHGEKSPSFIVSPTRQTYHCFGCGVHGNAVGFLMEHLGIGFIDAVKDLAQSAGMQVPEEERSPQQRAQEQAHKQQQVQLTDVLEQACAHYRKQLKLHPQAVAYLKRRGLTGKVAAHFQLGYAPEGWRALASAFAQYDQPSLVDAGLVILQEDAGKSGQEQKRYDRFRDRIMFPIRNVQGQVIGFGGRVLDKGEPKYLNSPETPVFSKGRELYGLFEARQALRRSGYALVVEGYMDVVALAQHGLGHAVATLGTACTPEHVAKLLRFTDTVVFSFDGDAAGRRAAARALDAALAHATDTRSFRFLFLPPEHDPDSYVRELGHEAFSEQMKQALPLSEYLLEHAAAGCDLQTAEGRARMLAQARPLWERLPVGVLQQQILAGLARQGQLSETALRTLWAPTSAQQSPQPNTAAKPRRTAAAEEPAYAEPPPWHDIPSPTSTEHSSEPPNTSATRPTSASPAPGTARKPWSKDGKGSWRRQPTDPTQGLPRQAPTAPVQRLVRILLSQSSLWAQLSEEDLHLLHALPGDAAQVLAWLERHITEHGPEDWAALRDGLAQDDLLETVQRLGGLPIEVATAEALQEDLAHVLRQLHIARLEQESSALASGNPDVDALRQIQALRLRIQQLKSAG